MDETAKFEVRLLDGEPTVLVVARGSLEVVSNGRNRLVLNELPSLEPQHPGRRFFGTCSVCGRRVFWVLDEGGIRDPLAECRSCMPAQVWQTRRLPVVDVAPHF